jgi:hypothetical protein
MAMRKILAVAGIALGVACGPIDQPESNRYVAAVEIPLKTAADRADLVTILRRHATADGGLHVDDVTDRWRQFEAEAKTYSPDQQGTIFVGVWRGADDDDIEADVGDSGHRGRAWLIFSKGRDPARSTKFREAVLSEIDRRWPDAEPLPVLPSGGLPLVDDLRMTASGYKISASSAANYELPSTSPLIARD